MLFRGDFVFKIVTDYNCLCVLMWLCGPCYIGVFLYFKRKWSSDGCRGQSVNLGCSRKPSMSVYIIVQSLFSELSFNCDRLPQSHFSSVKQHNDGIIKMKVYWHIFSAKCCLTKVNHLNVFTAKHVYLNLQCFTVFVSV